VNWAPELRDGRVTKPPISPKSQTGGYARIDTLGTLSDFDTAASNVESGRYPGIGYVQRERNGTTLLDFDDADETLQRHPEVKRELVRYRKRGGFVEVSPSGKGFHAVVRAELDQNHKGNKLEAYCKNRYFTGTGIGGGEVIDGQELVNAVVAAIARQKGQPRPENGQAKPEQGPSASGPRPTPEQLDRVEALARKELGTYADAFSPEREIDGGEVWLPVTVRTRFLCHGDSLPSSEGQGDC